MGEISVGAVGAAIIAGLISIIGLVISKEQKISEFRQAWINDLRQCLSDYLVQINAVCDATRLKNKGNTIAPDKQLDLHIKLNSANHGIRFRINETEAPAKEILASMARFEELAMSGGDLTPENIRKIEDDFIRDASKLLKLEWKRVKRGEASYLFIKRAAFIVTIVFIMLAAWLLMYPADVSNENHSFTIVPASQLKI
ncbi:hypothetical protein ABEB22_05670 [Thioclava sp. 'Guangxiensis']|uniref:hypothetical protein n=1 Tax=Thioclava sp. 'Guangxiensis' TaxID=3149044 RepID=UPI00387833AC